MTQRDLLDKYMKGEFTTSPFINYLHVYNEVEKKVFDHINKKYGFKLKSNFFKPKKSRQSSFFVIMVLPNITHAEVKTLGGIGHKQFGEGRTSTYFGLFKEKYYTITVDNRGSSIELPLGLTKEEFLECLLHIIDKIQIKEAIFEFANKI